MVAVEGQDLRRPRLPSPPTAAPPLAPAPGGVVPATAEAEIFDVEMELFLAAILKRYGYDFSRYARASLRRRLAHVLTRSGHESLSRLQHALLRDPDVFRKVLTGLTITTSDMFRDPSFFRALRERVLPILRTHPVLNIWHAGCSTGEEVYSLAIMLHEEGLYERCTIYGTDINPGALKQAREGIYSTDRIRDITANYQKAGGVRPFSDYYTADSDALKIAPFLQANTVFFEHNLVTDVEFIDAHLILCRNVLIYFDRSLQNRAVDLLWRSLVHGGFLGLGDKETVRFLERTSDFADFCPGEKIFRRASVAAPRPKAREGGP
jgi:chemotaxis protein methyltransferase CheR